MVYCISDVHGEYDRYQAMLAEIGFSDGDTLYLLGDAIDRGPEGVKVLEDVMSRPNVRMLLGNHEKMCLATLGPEHELGARQLWQQNGGSPTRRDLLYRRTVVERSRIMQFLRRLPDHLDVEVEGRRFHLVHGCPAEDTHGRIWGRPDPKGPAPIPGVTVIVGHTPTPYMTGDGEPDRPIRIWHGEGIIDIDCGCGNKTPYRRLACLRLNDMKEFYV